MNRQLIWMLRCIRRNWILMLLLFLMMYIFLVWEQGVVTSDDDEYDVSNYDVDVRDVILDEADQIDLVNASWRSDDTNCFRPPMELMPATFKKYYAPQRHITCGRIKDWVETQNGLVSITDHVHKMNTSFDCYVTPITRINDYKISVNASKTVKFSQRIKAPSDFMVASCNASNGKSFNTFLATTVKNSDLLQPKPFPAGSLGLNVLIIGLDSVSRMSWLRMLPKTANYFEASMGGVVLEGYNILGDGTTQALLPMFVGLSEADLPHEVRRGYADAQPLDDLSWLWKDYKKMGYVTQWGEDGTDFGTFQYRLVGFKYPPVHHYMRPFYMHTEKNQGQHHPLCFAGTPRFDVKLNYIKDLYQVYRHRPKFSFMFHSELSHDDVQTLQHADEPLFNFIKGMHSGGSLDNTMLILMSDHGIRFQDIRNTIQGKFEERLPYFGIWLPDHVRETYPILWQNLQSNRKVLTSPYDIHDTLRNVLHFDYDEDGPRRVSSERGVSLFQNLPENRTCAEAGVEPHWCTCLRWHKLDPASDQIQAVGWRLIHKINEITQDFREQCEELRIDSVMRAEVYLPESMLVRYRGSRDRDGRLPDFTDIMVAEVTFLVTVRTAPNNGIYEATVVHMMKEDMYRISEHQISRINKYGDQPSCIVKSYPHLRPFCYCTSS